mgnify:CR=1 FL=1|jgi:hypothetical protein
MDYSCQDISKITNPGLKRLYTIRCNRYKADKSEPVITKQSNDNLNINYLYLLLFLFVIIVIYYGSSERKVKTK